MKKIVESFRALNTIQKIEAVIAAVITAALFVGFPVYAWFSYSNELETLTRVQEPDNLDIRAGDYQPIVNFDLSGIDIEDMSRNGTTECHVFSVSAGDYKIKYNLQLAHTTNIPFKYTLWKAERIDDLTEYNVSDLVVYQPIKDKKEKTTITSRITERYQGSL